MTRRTDAQRRPDLPAEPLRLTPGPGGGETRTPGTTVEDRGSDRAEEEPLQRTRAGGPRLAECLDDLRRVKAEYDNYRKRVRRDRLAVREIAVANVLRRFLPVLDAIGAAREHGEVSDGFAHVADMLETETAALGLEAFARPGDRFDPLVHEALSHTVRPEAEEAVCTEVLRVGYRVGGQLLRPAQVAVAGPGPAGSRTP